MQNELYFYLKDRKHNKYLVAGKKFDGQLYHQDKVNDKGNDYYAQWTFEPVAPKSVDKPGSESYRIVNRKHKTKCIAAGDKVDNHMYLQDHRDRLNTLWTFSLAHTSSGMGGFNIVDALHHKCIVAGNQYDGHIYHQTNKASKDNTTQDNIKPESLWVMESVDQNTPIEQYPPFFILQNSIAVNRIEIKNPVNCLDEPDVVLSAVLTNNSSMQQSLAFNQSVAKASEDTYASMSAFGIGLLIGGSVNIGMSNSVALARANVHASAEVTYTRTSTTSYTVTDKTTYSIDTPVLVGPHSRMEATITIKRQTQTVEYIADITCKLADNAAKEHRVSISGTWKGVMVTGCSSQYHETALTQ